MKVLMLLDNPFVSDARVERCAKALIEVGYEVRVVCMKNNELPDEEERDGIKISRLLPGGLLHPLRKGYLALLKRISKELLIYSFNVIHCNDYQLLSLAAELKKSNPAAKLVYDSHEYFAGWPVYRDLSGLSNKIKAWVVWKWLLFKEQQIARKASLVIATTNSIKEKLQLRFGEKPSYIILRNIPVFSPPPQSNYLRVFFGINDDQYILLHSGNIYLTQAEFIGFVEGVEKVRNLVVVFLAKEEKVKELFWNLNEFQKKIFFFHPYVSGKRMGEVVSSADFGLVWVKSQWESHRFASPNRLMEYINCGLPYICNNSNDAINFIEEFNCGILIESFEEDLLQKALEKLILNYHSFKNGCLKARSSFSWEKESGRLINAYRNLR